MDALESGMEAQSNDDVDEDSDDNGGSDVDDALNVRYLALVWMGSCKIASGMV